MAALIRLKALLLALSAVACGTVPDSGAPPAYTVVEERGPAIMDGESDDLLTGGLGLEGLASAAPPTGASLRTQAIHYNYRALIDVTEAGGFTRIYGPDKDSLRIPGTEYLALLQLEGAKHPFAVAVAIPDAFDAARPCLVVAPSSGSRGLYGAIGTGGAAGLARGCAVVLLDKATGTGFVHLDTGETYDFALAPVEHGATIFSLAAEERAAASFGSGAVAVKHAHAGENVEAMWGRATLAAGDYALGVLNRHFSRDDFSRATTMVLGVSISNGGKALIMAAETDASGLLDGVVASEPNLAPTAPGRVIVGETEIAGAGRAMYDYATAMNLFAPCATQASAVAAAPGALASKFKAALYAEWCQSLVREDLLAGETTAEQGAAALAAIHALGFGKDTDRLLHYGVAIRLWPALAVAYANAYGRYGVADAPCGAYYAFGAPGAQRAPTEAEKAVLAAASSGVPPTGGVDIHYKDRTEGYEFRAALCFRALSQNDARVRAGMREVANSGRPKVPTIILHGRSDSLIPVSHASRAYVAAASDAAEIVYYEIENGNHFDAFLMIPELAAELSPMQPHVEKAVDLMIARLAEGRDLPPSQLVRNRPRGGALLGSEMLGAIRSDPGANLIEAKDGAIRIPE